MICGRGHLIGYVLVVCIIRGRGLFFVVFGLKSTWLFIEERSNHWVVGSTYGIDFHRDCVIDYVLKLVLSGIAVSGLAILVGVGSGVN